MAHNGGRSQLNFWFANAGREFPFCNTLKTAINWVSVDDTVRPSPSILNAQGYPTSISNGGVKCGVNIPTQTTRPGNWVLRWTGTGTFSFLPSATLVSGALSGTDGTAVITPGGSDDNGNINGFYLRITAIGASPLTNVELVHEDDLTAYDSGEIFRPGFISKLQEANFGVYRFLDWQLANGNATSKWIYRKPVDYYSYWADEHRSSIYAGLATLTGDNYTASLSGFTLTHGATAIVYFDAETSGAPTLNIEGTGAKPLAGWFGDPFTNGTTITVNNYGCVVYDANLDLYILDGADGTGISRALPNYFPIEICVALCNKLNAHPWLHVPHLALGDTTQDFATELATYCRDNLNEGLIPRFEPANEVWNAGVGYRATHYGRNVAEARWGFANDEHNWYGMVLSQMGEAISNVYSDDRTRYVVICGAQTYGAAVTARMASTRWVAEGGGKTPASDWATHGAVANYWGPSAGTSTHYPISTREMLAAYDYDNAATQAEKDTIAADFVTTDILTDTRFTPTSVRGRWDIHHPFFITTHGMTGLMCYEGGYSPDYTAAAITRTISAASKAAQCVLTLSSSSGVGLPPAGSTITISGVVGMTELNGNTYTVVSSSGNWNQAGNTITIAVDSTGFTTYTSGGTVTINLRTEVDTLREASKYAPEIEQYELELYNDFLSDYDGSFPSAYMLSGANVAWSIFDPNIFSDPTPRWQMIVDFNAVAAAPTADFTGTPLTGTTPLSVTFTDASTDTPTSWLWERNNGSGWATFSTSQNPTASFTQGTWSVRLTATNADGSDTLTRADYIVVGAVPTTGGNGRGKKKDSTRFLTAR
jgi:hypothetical protein